MKNNLAKFLAVGSLVVGGVVASGASAQAVQLAPGKLSLAGVGGVYFSNNALDFTTSPESEKDDFTVDGLFNVTTPLNPADPEAGVFGEGPLALDATRQFTGRTGQIADLFIPASSIPGGKILNNVFYDLEDDFGIPGGEFSFLKFDTDGDTSYGEADDFEYIITGFNRRVTPGTTGGFDVSLDFQGFFRDNKGIYDNTPSVISIFNGTSTQNPNNLVAFETVAEFALATTDVKFAATVDGTINTVASVPESSPTSALISFGLVASAFALKRRIRLG